MMHLIESSILVTFSLMGIMGIVALFLRKKIRGILKQNSPQIFDLYFASSGGLNQNIKSSGSIANFFITPKKWEGITNQSLMKLLRLNRKVEVAYYASFAFSFILFLSALLLKGYG